MGDPKKLRKQYARPLQMWQKQRVEDDRALVQAFGLKNRREAWKAQTMLRDLTKQAKKLTTMEGAQAQKETAQLLARLELLGLIEQGSDLNRVLAITVKDILGRRLQTVAYRRGLANSIKQARQFVVHRHIKIGERKINVPGYLVRIAEENEMSFDPRSQLANDDHPERAKEKKPEAPAYVPKDRHARRPAPRRRREARK